MSILLKKSFGGEKSFGDFNWHHVKLISSRRNYVIKSCEAPYSKAWLSVCADFVSCSQKWLLYGTSLVVQWLRICLALQGTWFQSLVVKLKSCMPWSNSDCVWQWKIPPNARKIPRTAAKTQLLLFSRSGVSDSATPWIIACQTPLLTAKNTEVGCHCLLHKTQCSQINK